MLFFSPDEQVWREVNASCTNGSRIDWPTFTIAAQVEKWITLHYKEHASFSVFTGLGGGVES